MESHPEEDYHGKHQTQGYHALGRLLLTQFWLRAGSLSLVGLTLATLYMTEGAAEDIVDGNRQNKRSTGDGKGEVITIVHACAKVLLRPLHDTYSCRRCKQRTNIDGHVEQREARITLVSILRVIVKVAHHHLEVTFEKSRSEADEHQSHQHHNQGKGVATEGYGE